MKKLFAALLVYLAVWSESARGDVAVLQPVADTTLIETVPSNNLGGMAYVNSGTTQNFARNRGLFRFDFIGSIPRGAWISNVTFSIEVVGKPQDGFLPADFELHRLLRPWGEGDKVGDPLHPGLGAPATEQEATWATPFALTTNSWSVPGGGAGTDFVASASSRATIYAMDDSPYSFNSSPVLVADVASWVDRPGDNYGWILICQTESADFTARRFGSRENSVGPPFLRVEFLPPPLIESTALAGDQFAFQFTARAGLSYIVEFKNDLATAGSWLELTNVPAGTADTVQTIVNKLNSSRRVYRLRIPQ